MLTESFKAGRPSIDSRDGRIERPDSSGNGSPIYLPSPYSSYLPPYRRLSSSLFRAGLTVSFFLPEKIKTGIVFHFFAFQGREAAEADR